MNMACTPSSYLSGISKIFMPALLFSLFVGCGPSKSLQRDLNDHLHRSTAFKTGFSGIYIFDPVEKETVYAYNADRYFIPASNIKLFTFYTGLKLLGDSVPGLSYITRNDSLIFRGTGDPSFLHPEYTYSRTLNFLNRRGEKLYLLVPDFEEKRFGPGWAWDDYNSSYSAERASFPIFGNLVTFSQDPDGLLTVSPPYFGNAVSPDSSGTKRNVIIRDPEQNFFTYSSSDRGMEQQVPFRYSYSLAAHLLGDTLQKEVNLIRDFPKKDYNSKTLYSIPTDSLYKRMLQESDNFIAEQILLLSAGQISDSLQAAKAIEFMKEHHLNDLPQEVKWVDGSGLSRYNLVSPVSIVALLNKILNEVPEERLFGLLAAGGISGTLKNSYKAGNPFIFAKTGSLGNVHNLSGYVRTRSGKILIFSIMNNNYMVPTSAIKAGMEVLLRNVHASYE